MDGLLSQDFEKLLLVCVSDPDDIMSLGPLSLFCMKLVLF
jgi:hypothetical protein